MDRNNGDYGQRCHENPNSLSVFKIYSFSGRVGPTGLGLKFFSLIFFAGPSRAWTETFFRAGLDLNIFLRSEEGLK